MKNNKKKLKRGTEGKIFAANYARVNKIPFLGLCYGFQVACIEFARNVLNIKNATSEGNLNMFFRILFIMFLFYL